MNNLTRLQMPDTSSTLSKNLGGPSYDTSVDFTAGLDLRQMEQILSQDYLRKVEETRVSQSFDVRKGHDHDKCKELKYSSLTRLSKHHQMSRALSNAEVYSPIRSPCFD